jgi:hypothetical protein
MRFCVTRRVDAAVSKNGTVFLFRVKQDGLAQLIYMYVLLLTTDFTDI